MQPPESRKVALTKISVSLPFADRAEAGRRLADRVRPLAATDPIALALPRGGVPVAAELARALRIPMDVLLVRKIGLPGQPELGVGALTEDGHVSFDEPSMARIGIDRSRLASTVEAERAELGRRLSLYRGDRPAPRLRGRDVLVVDDGLATGGTARAALRMVRRHGPARSVLAVPVGADSAVHMLAPEADEVVVLAVPEHFHAVGEWYRDFRQVSDRSVVALLEELRAPSPLRRSTDAPAHRVRLWAGDAGLDAELAAPSPARSAVVIACCGDEEAPQRRAVAAALHRGGYITLLLDLLTAEEQQRGGAVGDTALTARLAAAVGWLRRTSGMEDAPLGVFAGERAVPAALGAAGRRRPAGLTAVLGHTDRLEVGEETLRAVETPTLLLVTGARDSVREAAELVARAGAPCEVRGVTGAERLLGPSSAVGEEELGDAAAEWFARHLSG